MLYYLSYFLLLTLLPWSQSSAPTPTGTIDLDEISFDKILNKFIAVLVKFDVAYPYGEKHEAFTALGSDAKDFEDLLIAQVGVKDYGEKDNEALAQKYGATKENFPVVKLFIKGQSEPLSFDDEFTSDNLRKFIRKYTGFHLSLPGCVRVLDELVEKFVKASSADRTEVLKSFDKIDLTEKDVPSGKIYKRLMEKIIEKGDDFINTENDRVKKLLTTKLSKEKVKDLSNRLNILQTFLYLTEEKVKKSKDDL